MFCNLHNQTLLWWNWRILCEVSFLFCIFSFLNIPTSSCILTLMMYAKLRVIQGDVQVEHQVLLWRNCGATIDFRILSQSGWSCQFLLGQEGSIKDFFRYVHYPPYKELFRFKGPYFGTFHFCKVQFIVNFCRREVLSDTNTKFEKLFIEGLHSIGTQ